MSAIEGPQFQQIGASVSSAFLLLDFSTEDLPWRYSY